MPQAAPRRIPYFHRPSTHALISELAATQHLTLVVGAGWSADWGLPTWDQLLRRLLADAVAPSFGIDALADRQTFADELIASHGLIGSASIAREALEDFGVALSQALYKTSRGTYGAAAYTVGRLVAAWRGTGQLRIITLNYDYALEEALRVWEVDPRTRSLGFEPITVTTRERLEECIARGPGEADGDAPQDDKTLISNLLAAYPTDRVPVFHLHGALGLQSTRAGKLIFSEEDYLLSTNASGWQDELLRQCLGDPDGACLFLGMQLSDPNVVRQLFYASAQAPGGSGSRRIAFLPIQGDRHWAHTDEVAQQIELAIRERLNRLHIDKVAPTFFTQVPQVLNEIAICRSVCNDHSSLQAGLDAYSQGFRYGLRLQGWRDLMHDEKQLRTDKDCYFEGIQKLNHEVLRAFRGLLYEVLQNRRVNPYTDERFGVVLWARNPRPEELTLELWGSSERAWLERATILAPPIESDSPYAAVRAFCGGPTSLEETRKEGSRWALNTSAVIYLGGEYRRLPVGVITLESDFGIKSSCLVHLDSGDRQTIAMLMAAVGEALLTPGLMPSELLGSELLGAEGALRRDYLRKPRDLVFAISRHIAMHHSQHKPQFAEGNRASWTPAKNNLKGDSEQPGRL